MVGNISSMPVGSSPNSNVPEIAVWLLTGISSSSSNDQIGSNLGWNTGNSELKHGRSTPRSPASLAQRISVNAASTSSNDADAMPAKRSGAAEQKSTSHRL